ncbi:MAG: multidrug transporter [Oceanospirillaceae bacterium]|nr:multidrug transporter [Oceanospirillaceae bacterium]
MKRMTTLAAAIALVSGCSMMPDYQRPEVTAISQWSSPTSTQLAAADTGWKNVIEDPALEQVIALALEQNKDLRAALLNVQRYQAQYQIQRAALLPEVGADGSSTRQRVPETLSGASDASISSQYGVTLGVSSYELDLFGRVSSLEEAALQRYLAQEATLRSTQISLVAGVTNAYLTWVADREQLNLARETLQIESENRDLVQQRYDLGVASELELAQAHAAYEDAEVMRSRYQRLTEVDRNALTLLIGQPLPEDWSPASELAAVSIAGVEPGLPSDLLQQRPDLIAAERQLQAANAAIGAAKAAYFPSIRLTANAGTLSSEFSDLFDANSGTWLFSPSINLPLFTGGRLDAELETAEVDRDLAVNSYQKAVQTAFTEVADALSNRAGFANQLDSQKRALEAYQRYYDIADQRYRNGIDSMLTRLDAQRNLVASRQAAINARLSLLQAEVDLYRALGGGWLAESEASQ